jgi:hypothetical protein
MNINFLHLFDWSVKDISVPVVWLDLIYIDMNYVHHGGRTRYFYPKGSSAYNIECAQRKAAEFYIKKLGKIK